MSVTITYSTDILNRDTDLESLVNSFDDNKKRRLGEMARSSQVPGVIGNRSILKDLKDSKAHVMFVGDSISNNGSTAYVPAVTNQYFTTLWHSSLVSWKPDVWEGAWWNTQASSVQGVFVLTNATNITETTNSSKPGSGACSWTEGQDNDEMEGNYSTIQRWGKYTSSIPSNTNQEYQVQVNPFNYAPDATKTSFYEERFPNDNLFVNSSNTQVLANGSTPLKIGGQFVGYGTANYADKIGIRLQNTINSNVGFVNYSDQSLNTKEGAWVTCAYAESTPPAASTASSGNLYLGFFRHADDAVANQKLALGNIFVGSNQDGLVVSYAGTGGWKLGNHGVNFPDGDLLTIGDPSGDVCQDYEIERWSYTDEHMKARLEAEETTHIFLHLGANDLAQSDAESNSLTFGLDRVLRRFRSLKSDLKFIITTLYPTQATVDSSAKEAIRNSFNEEIKNFAYKNTDVVVVDTNQAFGSLTNSVIVSSFISDGVHLNQSGAKFIMDYVWTKVIASVTSLNQIPPNVFTVNSQEEYTSLMNCVQLLK